MKIQTIEGIELSSLCNLACRYCINPQIDSVPGRTREILNPRNFDLAAKHLADLVQRGTQGRVINLNGNGESLLDPDLPQRARMIKEIVGEDRHVQLSTNGVALTLRLAMDMHAAGIDGVEVSAHSVIHAAIAVQHISRAGFGKVAVNMGAIGTPHEWAGQRRWLPNGVAYLGRCDPILEGRIYIQSDGSVVACCYDYQSISAVGHVEDRDLLDREVQPFELCRSCHQSIDREWNEDSRGQVVDATTGAELQ